MNTPSKSRLGIVRFPNMLISDMPNWLEHFLSEMKIQNTLPAIINGGYAASTEYIGTHPRFDEVEWSETFTRYEVGQGPDGLLVTRQNN